MAYRCWSWMMFSCVWAQSSRRNRLVSSPWSFCIISSSNLNFSGLDIVGKGERFPSFAKGRRQITYHLFSMIKIDDHDYFTLDLIDLLLLTMRLFSTVWYVIERLRRKCVRYHSRQLLCGTIKITNPVRPHLKHWCGATCVIC